MNNEKTYYLYILSFSFDVRSRKKKGQEPDATLRARNIQEAERVGRDTAMMLRNTKRIEK